MTTEQVTSSTTLLDHEMKSGGKGASSGSILPSTSGADELVGDVSSHTTLEYIEENKAAEASDIELFTDLTVVVAIHVLSDLLTEGDENGDENVWWWFILRVFFIYSFWHGCSEVANLHNLFFYHSHRWGTPVYYIIMFVFMALLVALTNACQNDHNRHAAIIYLFGRVLGLTNIRVETLMRRPISIDEHQHEFFRRISLTLPKYFLFETVPFVLALIFRWESETAILWGGLLMVVLRIVMRFVIGLRCDISNDYENWDGKLANTDHTKERYKLVTLIFLGELCFSSAAGPWDVYTSLSALVTAFGCFLCYFNTRVDGRTEAWDRSALCNLQAQTSHFIIFCAVPIMGVGFVEMMNENKEGESDGEEGGEQRWYQYPHAILSMAAGVYLIMLGMIEMFTKDPEIPGQQVRMIRRTRVILYFIMGSFLEVSHLCSSAASTYVPLVILATAHILIWGTRVHAV